ncbi:MAG: type II toxin-antitoxin system VapC family toxin [Rhizobiaceae bacterium]
MSPERIYLDANIFIAMLEQNDAVSRHLLQLFASAPHTDMPRLVTSELTLAETIVAPIREGNAAELASYERTVASSEALEVVPVDRKILLRAGELRAFDTSLRLPDAIHVARAISADCKFILTADKRLAAALERPSRVAYPVPAAPTTEMLADLIPENRS